MTCKHNYTGIRIKSRLLTSLHALFTNKLHNKFPDFKKIS